MDVSADDVKGIGVERVVLGPAASCHIMFVNHARQPIEKKKNLRP
jgi:hypothetical protein